MAVTVIRNGVRTTRPLNRAERDALRNPSGAPMMTSKFDLMGSAKAGHGAPIGHRLGTSTFTQRASGGVK